MTLLLSQNNFFIGDWLVVPAQNQLQQAGQRVQIEPKLMEVLIYLCQAAPNVVHANELIDQCWPNQYISDNPVHKCVAQLRKALNDDARNPSYIKTIPKKGYSVIHTVRQSAPNRQNTAAIWEHGPPYLGSQPYQPTHRDIFFGRQKSASEIKRLINETDMDVCQNLLILGPPKVAKTSIFNVEILPFLQNPAKPFKKTINNCKLFSISTTSSDHPVDALNSFVQSKFNDTQDQKNNSQSSNGKQVLIIDQLESLLQIQNKPSLNDFFAYLTQLQHNGAFFLIMILNHDYYAQFMEVEAFRQVKSRSQNYDILPPDAEEIRNIIKQPVHSAGLSFQFDKTNLNSLADVICKDAMHLSNALPILSQAMHYLCTHTNQNQELTFAAYQQMGQLKGFLANKAETVFNQFSDHSVSAFMSYLPQLITLSAENTLVLNSIDLALITDSKAKLVIDKLIAADLINTSSKQNETYVKLVHESLLYESKTLNCWLVQNQLALSVQSEIQRQALIWKENQRKDVFLNKNPYLLQQARQTNSSQLASSFLQKSIKRYNRSKLLSKALLSGLLMLTVIATYLWIDNQQINQQLLSNHLRAEALNGFMMEDLKQKLQPIGQLELLEMVSQEVIAYYQTPNPFRDSEDTTHINALNTLAEVYIKQGKHQEASQLLTQSKNLLKSHPLIHNDTEVIFQLGQTNYWLGYIQYLQKHWSAVKPNWQAYLNHTNTLTAFDPDNRHWLLEQSYAYNNLGSLMLKQNDLVSASEYINQSAEIKNQLVQSHPENLQYLADLSDTVSWQASISESKGEFKKANDLFLKSLQLAEQLITKQADNQQWIHRFGLALYRSGLSFYDLGQIDQAKNYVLQANKTFQELTAIDPLNKTWNKTTININILLSKIYRNLDDLDLARLYLDSGMSYFENYSPQSKTLPASQQQLKNIKTESSLILFELGQIKAAQSLFNSIYHPLITEWQQSTSDSLEYHINVAKKTLVYHLLNEQSSNQQDRLVLMGLSDKLLKLNNQNNHKALALQKVIAQILQPTSHSTNQQSFNQNTFNNPDFFITEETL